MTRIINFLEITFYDENLFLFMIGTCQDFSKRACDKGSSPEFKFSFLADSVNDCDIYTVRNGVSSLNCFPSLMLNLASFWTFVFVPANGRGIKNNLSTCQRGQSSRFRKPLIPTNQGSNAAISSLETVKTQISGCKIEFFIETGIVRNVHFSILSDDFSVRVNDDGRIVINT